MIRLNNATDQALLVAAWVQTAASILAIVVGVLGVVLAVRGISIARATAREQRENRAFPRDLAYSDRFANSLAGLSGRAFLNVQPVPGTAVPNNQVALPIRDWMPDLEQACVEYTRHVTDAFLGVAQYMQAVRQKIQKIVVEREKGSSYDWTMDEIAIDAYLGQLNAVAFDWVFPERRAATKKRMDAVIREVNPNWTGGPLSETEPKAK